MVAMVAMVLVPLVQKKSYDIYTYVGTLSIIAIALFVYFKMPEKTEIKTAKPAVEPINKKVYKSML